MRTAVLIDDEINSLEILQYEIERLDVEIEILATCSDARKAKDILESLKPDIVFLDIEMPWHSGFEVLDQLDYLDFHLVFVTAYDQYAIKAFKYLAFDYLLKPVDHVLLSETIDRIFAKNEVGNNQDLKSVLDLLKSGQFGQHKIPFPTQDGFEFYTQNEIIRCEADSNYTKIITANEKSVLISKTLKHVESVLDENLFMRSHQSHLININHISKYSKADGGYILMKDGSQVPISRSKRVQFLERIGRMERNK